MAQKTAKELQLLDAHNNNISPITGYDSIYFEEMSNGAVIRKSLAKNIPTQYVLLYDKQLDEFISAVPSGMDCDFNVYSESNSDEWPICNYVKLVRKDTYPKGIFRGYHNTFLDMLTHSSFLEDDFVHRLNNKDEHVTGIKTFQHRLEFDDNGAGPIRPVTGVDINGIMGRMAGTEEGTDYFGIFGYGTADEGGYLEIATASDGNEPIYVTQYSGGHPFSPLATREHEIILMNDLGNQNLNSVNARGDVSVDRDLRVACDTSLQGYLKVSGDTSLHGTLDVEQDTFLQSNASIGGTLDVIGDTSIQGNLHIFQNTSIRGGLDIYGDTSTAGNVSSRGWVRIMGDVSIWEDLYVSGDVSMKGDVSVGGYLKVTGDTSLHGTLDVEQDTFLQSNASIGGTLDVIGDTSIQGDLNIFQNVSIGQNLDVIQNTSLRGSLKVWNDVSITGDTSIGGYLKVSGDTSLHGTLDVEQDTFLQSNASIGGTLDVEQDTFLQSNASIGGTLDVIGDTSLHNDLHVLRDTSIRRNLYVFGNTNLSGDLTLDSNLWVKGWIRGESDVSILKTLNVKEATTLQSTLNVTGKTVISDNLAVDGQVDVGGAVKSSYLWVKYDASIGGDISVYGNSYTQGYVGSQTPMMKNNMPHGGFPGIGGWLASDGVAFCPTTNGNDRGGLCFREDTLDSGVLFLYTADNGNEPIYARQYDSNGVLHQVSLMDASGNQSFNYVKGTQFESTVATGTAPFVVKSTTVVGNLNADLLDGTHKADLFTAFGNSGDTNTTITVGGTTKTHTIQYATGTDHVISQGRQANATSTTSEPAGIRMFEAYNNGYPCTYGNIIRVLGQPAYGGSDLLLEWSGGNPEANGATPSNARIWYRNKRDNNPTWSAWRGVMFLDEKYVHPTFNPTNGGGTVDVTDGSFSAVTSLTFNNGHVTAYNIKTINIKKIPGLSVGKLDVNNLGTTQYNVLAANGGGESKDVYGNGNCKISKTGYYVSSDRRLKDDIKTLVVPDKLPEIKEFVWKNTGTKSVGIIAQEMEEVGMPDVVYTDPSTDLKTVNYDTALCVYTAWLMKQVKELKTEVQELRKELSEYKK